MKAFANQVFVGEVGEFMQLSSENFENRKSILAMILFSICMGGLISSCTISSPATETPLPDNQNIEKAFFVSAKGEPKTFLCGWASETEVGEAAGAIASHNVPLATHCNLQFEVTENALIGRRVNPSFPNDTKRWAEIVTVPITKHYYYEKAKDENGRDKNAFIENDSRSHWSARPFMKLDLSHMKIYDWAYAIPGGREAEVLSVDDIEWDQKNHFLGFTVVTNDPLYGTENQGRYRINFAEFTHNPNFKVTPFNDKNYKLINALHIIGEKAEGVYPILHAAHWDATKVHDVYLNDFPAEYVSIAEDIVKEWNETLVSVQAFTQSDVDAGKAGFRINKEKHKHSFDLRYPSITWVSDMKISTAPSSPLGIAMSQADVRNGEMLWGSITLYGGIIEHYIKSYASVAGAADSAAQTSMRLSGLAKSLMSKMASFQTPSVPSGMDLSGASLLNVQQYSKDYIDSRLDKAAQVSKDSGVHSAQQLSHAAATRPVVDYSSKIQTALQRRSKEEMDKIRNAGGSENFQDYIVDKMFSLKKLPQQDTKDLDSKSSKPTITVDQLVNISNGSTLCMDRTFADVAPGWVQGMSESKRDYDDVLRSLVKELIIHEFGHFIGLGHQFKENILPERGTVPDAIYNDLAKKATAEEGYTQFTSVMGYRHPRSEMRTKYEDVKPGPHDRLVLAYLYTQKYSTFKQGDSDFTFVELPKDGIIPQGDGSRTTSYFPQCNDITASLSLDPFCNRFDRGHNATEIVDNYFSDINDNLEQSHFAFTDAKGANPEGMEANLWRRNFSTLGRIRLFYDFMRKKYRDDIDSISQDESSLYEFSTACKSGKSSNPKLSTMFNSKPELKELCQVNANVIDQLRLITTKNLSEYTKVDQSTAYIPAGITGGDTSSDYGHALGSWTQLSSAPLKIPALYTLLASGPWVEMGSDPIATVANYTREDSGFSYSSLYPYEYTNAISYSVRDNLKFSNLDGRDEGNRLGRVILALGGLSSSIQNNERRIFPKHYLDTISAQSEFSLTMVAITIEAIPTSASPIDHADRFTGLARDLYGDVTPISEVYLLPNRQVIVNANDMFLFPISKLELTDDHHFFVLAYKLSYSHEYGDLLAATSVKTQLQSLHDQVMRSCLEGNDKNGVAQYFKNGNPDFPGFVMLPGMTSSPASIDKFDISVTEEFRKYYEKTHSNASVCDDAMNGLGLIMSSAAIINGGWLAEAKNYLLNTF